MWAPFVFGFQEAGDCAGRRGRWGWDAFGDWSGGHQRGSPHWHGRAARLFLLPGLALQRLTERLTELLSDKNQNSISDILENVDKTTKVLAERQAGRYAVDVIQFSEPATALESCW